MRRGQLALADVFDDISEEELLAAAPSEDKLYVALMEATSTDKSGESTKKQEFQDNMRVLLKALPEGKIPVFVPFSTNHLEYQSLYELCNEPEILRHTTEVGANAQHRATAMNNHVVDPDLDLTRVEIPHEKLPKIAYDTALKAVQEFLDKHMEKAESKLERSRRGTTLEDILKDSVPYQVFKHIQDQAEAEIAKGAEKPKAVFEAFFNGNDNKFEDLARELGFPPNEKPRKMPRIVRNAIAEARKELRENSQNTMKISEDFEQDRDLTDADTTYWMLRSLEKHGGIKFKAGKDLINQTNMYRAIMNDQDLRSVRRTRSCKTADRFRMTPDDLAVFITGPMGSAEEYFATLSRWVRGDSLFDYDEVTRNTGYKLDPEDMIPIITQPPSMGSSAERAQDALLQLAASRHDTTIMCATPKGMKIFNPGQHQPNFLRHFQNAGWDAPDIDAANNRMWIHGRGFHIEGHAHFDDMKQIYGSDYFKARNVELIHTSSEKAIRASLEIAEATGNVSTIREPKDWIMRKAGTDETGAPVMENHSTLTPRTRLIRKITKFGRQYGWQVDMKLALGLWRGGDKRQDGLNVRSHPGDFYHGQTSWKQANDFLKPGQGRRSQRERALSPSFADVQKKGGRLKSPMAASLIARQRQGIDIGQNRGNMGGYNSSPDKGPKPGGAE